MMSAEAAMERESCFMEGVRRPQRKKKTDREDDFDECYYTHMCKICKKKFVSGQAFGGHMRIHGPVATAAAAAAESNGKNLEPQRKRSHAAPEEIQRSDVEDEEDSQLDGYERSSMGREFPYWKSKMESTMEDYKMVDGVNIADAGRSVITLFKFGEAALHHTRTKMEESWTIKETAFNVQGLSMDCFLPPADLKDQTPFSEACDLIVEDRGRSHSNGVSRNAKVAALDRSMNTFDDSRKFINGGPPIINQEPKTQYTWQNSFDSMRDRKTAVSHGKQ